MTLKALLVVTLGVSAMTAFGYWRYQESAKIHAVAQYAFIQDTSDSISMDCDRIVGLAERALTMPQTGAGSTITLFALGNSDTADEPQLLGEFKVPVTRRVIEGSRAAARDRTALLSNIQSRCSNVKQIKVSPIFQSVGRAVEHLRGVGSKDDYRYLFVQTDGEETQNRQIKLALNREPGTQFKPPLPITNSGIHVTFCGMAETIGTVKDERDKSHRKSRQRDSDRSERLREVWSKVFSDPELVTFEPYCSRGERAGK